MEQSLMSSLPLRDMEKPEILMSLCRPVVGVMVRRGEEEYSCT
jgi:hypothetical protein